jgi:[acyl-carrier-protein] S-malonyltransferase
MEKTLFIFPGQGAQYRGMGHDLFKNHEVVRHTYEEANDILLHNIADTSFLDPEKNLNLTRYTQPALLTHSIACLRLFTKQVGQQFRPDAAAGHSLGEYSALVAAGGLDFSTALELVQKRGELMSKFGQGEMEALSVPRETAEALALKHYCGVAACNLPEQTVVGGLPDDLSRLVDDLKELDPKKNSTRLKTEGAFHTYFMVEAAKRFRLALEDAEVRVPSIQVLSNFSGTFHESEPDSIKVKLFLQLFHPVLWYQNLEQAAQIGINNIIEFGGGIGKGDHPNDKKPNLASIVKRTFRRANNPPDYHAVINGETLNATVTAITT